MKDTDHQGVRHTHLIKQSCLVIMPARLVECHLQLSEQPEYGAWEFLNQLSTLLNVTVQVCKLLSNMWC